MFFDRLYICTRLVSQLPQLLSLKSLTWKRFKKYLMTFTQIFDARLLKYVCRNKKYLKICSYQRLFPSQFLQRCKISHPKINMSTSFLNICPIIVFYLKQHDMLNILFLIVSTSIMRPTNNKTIFFKMCSTFALQVTFGIVLSFKWHRYYDFGRKVTEKLGVTI